MPLERISKEFKDISMTFQSNPLNRDLIGIKNETAIARSVKNLVLTSRGEKFFNSNFGTGVSKLLFETIDEMTASIIKDEISSILSTYEPRIEVTDIVVKPNYDENEFATTIQYKIVGIDVLPQQLSFALQPAR
jgi:phage baseplate assembly protein W